jgi:hypothetical protein
MRLSACSRRGPKHEELSVIDPEKRALRNKRQCLREKERWNTEPEFRERKLARNKAWHDANRDDINARQRERYANDPVYRANHQIGRLKSKYGLSREDFAALLDRQHHACANCERPFTRKPCVDHCHVTGLVRGLLCGGCNLALGHLEDNPVFAHKAGFYLERWYAQLFQLFTEENTMTSTNDDTNDNKAARLMREAILHELHQPYGAEPPPPSNWLQAVSRFLVTKAAQDLSAAKEVLDRIDGRTPSASITLDQQKEVNVSWKFPLSKLNSPGLNPPDPETEEPVTRSSARRAGSSSRSTNGTNASPAS